MEVMPLNAMSQTRSPTPYQPDPTGLLGKLLSAMISAPPRPRTTKKKVSNSPEKKNLSVQRFSEERKQEQKTKKKVKPTSSKVQV